MGIPRKKKNWITAIGYFTLQMQNNKFIGQNSIGYRCIFFYIYVRANKKENEEMKACIKTVE